MLEIAVCGSGERARQVTALLDRWAWEASAQIGVSQFEDSARFLKDYAPGRFVCVFLDTELSGRSGLETARDLRNAGDGCQIVFFSDSARQALACYAVHPAGFFRAPIAYEALQELFQWHKALLIPALQSITVTSARAQKKVFLSEILYLFVTGRTSNLVLKKGGSIPTNRTLNQLEQELEQFFRCHRGFLVNPVHIRTLDGRKFTMDNGAEIPISEEKLAQARQRMTAWSDRKF